MQKYLKLILLSLTFIFLSKEGCGQEVPDSLVVYDSDYKFTEGVFLDFNSVKRNSPIPKSRILSNVDYSDKDFFDRVLSAKKLYYYDNLGNKVEIRTDGVWGYSRNGFLYVNVDDGYFRITLIGSICHFIGYRTYESYASNYPYSGSYYSGYPYSSRTPTTTTTEMQQFILDFDTGNIIEYSVEGVEVALMADPELHDEYMQLSKKKKKQLKFVYIRRFNERNPLYLIKD